MAIQPQTPYKEYDANGVTTSFALEFDCEKKDHLIVTVDGAEPPVETWSLNSGHIVFASAPATGKKIEIKRNTPYSRSTNFQAYDNSFRPGPVNMDFDRIWLKLQELGVADWLLRMYVDLHVNKLQQGIKDLKDYVDDQDDQLRAYLIEEIRKQGVALDQLDEYYNYLMQRLAQIAIEKGWEASFIVDESGKNQQEINNITMRTVENIDALREFGAKHDQVVHVNYHTVLGYGQGTYKFELGSTKTDNNGAWIRSNVISGTWVLISDLHFENFGVTDADVDQSSKVQACIDFAQSQNIVSYGFEKSFKCRIDKEIVFRAIKPQSDWGMPDQRTEISMRGAMLASTVNNLTYIRILRDRVEFVDTLAIDGLGSTGQVGIALGYEKTDDPMDTSLRRSACFMVLNGYFPANIDIGIKSNIPRSVNGSTYGMYNHKVYNFDARHVNIGWYADKGFADDPVTNKLTRTRVFGFGHIDGACSFYMLACESFKCYGYSGEHLEKDDPRLPNGKAVAWYSPEKANPIDTYQNSYNSVSGFVERAYREYVNDSVYFTWDVESWFTETTNDVAKQGVAELSLSKMGIGSNGTFYNNRSVKDFHFKNGGFRTAVVSITKDSAANTSLPSYYRNKDFYGNIQWIPMSNDWEDTGLLILTDLFWTDGGFRQYVSQYRNGAWSSWSDLSFKYGIGNNDISIINTSLNNFKFTSGGVRFAQVAITGDDAPSAQSCPNGSYFYGAIQWIQVNEVEGKQIAWGSSPNSNSCRTYTNNAWSAWVPLAS